MGIAATVAAIAAAAGFLGTTINRSDKGSNSFVAYKKYADTIKSLGMSDSVSPEDIIGNMYLAGELDAKAYKRSLSILKDTESGGKAFDTDNYANIFSKEFWIEFGTMLGHTGKTHKEATDLWNQMADYLPALNKIKGMTKKEIENAIYSGVTQAPYAPAPTYEDTNIDLNGGMRDVEPVKFWTGQELADLHNIDYDPNNYYDLIKNSTTAQKNLAEFKSDQLNNASTYNDVADRTSYLNSIRNSKAEAIATGTTAGQRAANEVLANQQALTKYATNQNDVAANRMKAVDDTLLSDAQAKLNARNYFDKLAQSLSKDSLTLYQNDTDRFGQDMLSNAEIYKANQALLAQRLLSNAEMWSNNLSANANIGAYNTAARAPADEVNWVFNNALRAYNGDVLKAFNYTTNNINNNYNGTSSVYDYINSVLNKN